MNLREAVERRYVGHAVAFVAGVSFSLSFAPIGWWPLAILTPAVLMWLWEGAAPKRAAWLGFWFAAGTFAAGTYWLYISLKLIGGAPMPLALLLMISLVAIMGLYHWVLGWVVAKYFPARGALRWMVAIPGAWLLVEWFRSWFLSGFGWLAIGYSQTDTWLGSLAPAVGQFGIALLALVCSGALLTLGLGTKRERIVAGIAIVAIWSAGYLAGRVTWTQPFGRPITVAVIQGAIPQDEKWLTENLKSTMALYEERSREAYGSDLVVWPESAIPALFNDLVPYFDDVYREASLHGSALVLGAIREDRGLYYNSVLALEPGAQGPGWYDKHHLVPFAEFFPVPQFVRDWLRLMNLPYADFTRGAANQETLAAASQRIAASVCYEDAYGSSQLHALERATLLVNVTNDAWFGHSTARYQHLQISRLRAMEADKPLIRAANNGVSAAIDADGHVLVTAPEYEANVMRATVQPRTGRTPYAYTGNWPSVCLALVFGLFGAYVRRR
ncbi:MAG TPA: apolipoprotein N-acyltransferase [Steroidobacteraceae bacterium]|nr:apolipoprotein N-acyltransferase [Steroidobacteraceae bacterium]